MDSETSQGLSSVIDVTDSGKLQIQIPIGGVPELVLETANAEKRIASNDRARNGDEVLHKQPFQQHAIRHRRVAGGQRASPEAASIAGLVDDVDRVQMHDAVRVGGNPD